MSYQEFIARKRRRAQLYGFEPVVSNPHLMDWQARIVDWAIRRGRAALFEGTGLGKTLQQLCWGENVVKRAGPVLLVCPLGVRQQTMEEAAKFGIGCEVRVAAEPRDCGDGINITNYDRAHKFDAGKFSGVILDECFPPGTPVDMESGAKSIEMVRCGDRIRNAFGVDTVKAVHRREVKSGIAFTAGSRIIVSQNHPVFTQRGWVCAQDLEPGDSILRTGEAVRVLREGISSVQAVEWDESFLREVLLSEMANETAAIHSESSHAGSGSETRTQEVSVVQVGVSDRTEGSGADTEVESDVRSASEREGIEDTSWHEAQTFSAWWKRQGDDAAPEHIAGCPRQWMGSRVSRFVGFADGWLSNALQDRLSEQRAKSCYRGGWSIASDNGSKEPGQEERRKAGFVRVESVEVLEQGNPELERFRASDGKLYFYDIEAERHPSFSVFGLLVHNSSILKNIDGKTRKMLCEMFANTRYKLAATATPSPNDHAELGSHAEFLGVMKAPDMLNQFFFHDSGDTGKWTLMPHATKEFWAWVASWAVCIGMPSDIGGSDDGFVLPELRTQRHLVEANDEFVPSGYLFNLSGVAATSVHQEKRMTVDARIARAVDIIQSEPGRKCVVWCDTNQEQDMLEEKLGASCVSIRGATDGDKKEELERQWRLGDVPVLVTKGSIFGAGMNWQHCSKMVFVGLTYSFEQYFQSVRRCWRFGQKLPVDVHVVVAETETAMQSAVARKESDFYAMREGMAEAMRERTLEEFGLDKPKVEYKPTVAMPIPEWFSKEV